LLWQTLLVISVILQPTALPAKVVALILLVVLYAAFMVLGPILWHESTRVKLLVIVAYWAVTFLLFPLIGPVAIWIWLLVVSLAAFTQLPLRAAITVCVLVVVVQVMIGSSTGFGADIAFAPIVTVVCAATLLGLGLLTKSNKDLRVAHEEIARLAVVEERARFGRDLHDVLGHSLTVVAVKSDLARRLISLDPDRAEAEIADIEKLARSALSDLRIAVSNYREIAFDTELVAARTALSAAGITAHLPGKVDEIDPELQGVFAWVLREGITNVIRHSGATSCWVTAGVDHMTISDDGGGAQPTGTGGLRTDRPIVTAAGNGLRGLRERTAEAGAEVIVRRSSRGGFELMARRIA
jgi:two-component system sensor histidine kinase DesK